MPLICGLEDEKKVSMLLIHFRPMSEVKYTRYIICNIIIVLNHLVVLTTEQRVRIANPPVAICHSQSLQVHDRSSTTKQCRGSHSTCLQWHSTSGAGT